MKHAEFLYTRGERDSAKKMLIDVTKQVPDYMPAWRLLAQLAANEKDYKTALANLENVFSRDPRIWMVG